MTQVATVAEVESLLGDTMNKVEDTNRRIAKIEDAAMINAKAHETVAQAITMMAQTFKLAEDRQGRLESTNQELYKAKNQSVSPNVFFMVTGTLCAVIIMGGVWITNTSIEATLTSFKAGKESAEKLAEVKQELIQEKRDGN